MQAGGLSDKFFEDVLLQDMHDSLLHHEEGEDSWLDLHDSDAVLSGPRVRRASTGGAELLTLFGCWSSFVTVY